MTIPRLPPTSRIGIASRVSLAATLVVAAALSHCSPNPAASASCVGDREYFQREVWATFMGQTCTKCHTPDGPAVERGARFVLETESFPGFLDRNLEAVRTMARTSFDGTSVLLQKPTGGLGHGGGVVVLRGSEEYRKLEELVARLGRGTGEATATCEPGPNAVLNAVTRLSPRDTFRKAAIDLGGRLPTSEESAALATADEARLDAALDSLLREKAFLERVREWYNDLFLTDRALQYGGAAINFLDDELYPGIAPYKSQGDPLYADEKRPLINRALAREPLDLIAYVVAGDKPFSEVVSADYAVVNPYSAIAYGLSPAFKSATDPDEFLPVRLTLADGSGTAIPHAGVLSTPSFLNRWQTTPTNRNRARARRVFQFFLATDLLKIAERPVDASNLTAVDNPTRNSPYCNVCHKVMDPVAGGFRGWDEFNYEKFSAKGTWYADMVESGFGNKTMDPAYYGKGLSWLGPEIAKDPRFSLAAIHAAYRGLTGRPPLTYPAAGDPNMSAKLSAWDAQDRYFRALADEFVKTGMNFKTVVKRLVTSPYYSGVGLASSGERPPDAALAGIGVGTWLSPEALNRKIHAVFGAKWRKRYSFEKEHDWLLEDYTILYGGIDSDTVTSRISTIGPVAAAVAARMANEVACANVAWDFTRPKSERILFPLVETTDTAATAESVIRATLVALHERILGESLSPTSEEIARSFALYSETEAEMRTSGKERLPYECQGRQNPVTGEELPSDKRLTTDKTGSIRAWQATVTYLLSDWRFLFQ